MFSISLTNPSDASRLPLDRARAALLERSEWVGKILAEAGPELDPALVKSVPINIDDGSDLAGIIQRVSAEMDALSDRVNQLAAAEEVARKAAAITARYQPQAQPPQQSQPRSLGELVAKAVGDLAGRPGTITVAVDQPMRLIAKAALTTTGAPPDVIRTDVIAWSATEPIRIVDIIPTVQTSQAAYAYLEETTLTNAAAERAENTVYPEAALAYTERSVPIRSIGVRLPVTDEALADFAGLQAIVEGRLRYMLQARLDTQIINGNGTAPNLLGTLNVTGIQTQARGTDSHLDAIHKALTKVRSVGKAEPSVVILNHADWQTVRLSKTADGVYLLGAPADAGVPRVWGVPVLGTSEIAQGTGLVGDYQRHAVLAVNAGIDVQVGLNSDDFANGRQTIRAGLRCAVVHYRPAAFCTVTGL